MLGESSWLSLPSISPGRLHSPAASQEVPSLGVKGFIHHPSTFSDSQLCCLLPSLASFSPSGISHPSKAVSREAGVRWIFKSFAVSLRVSVLQLLLVERVFWDEDWCFFVLGGPQCVAWMRWFRDAWRGCIYGFWHRSVCNPHPTKLSVTTPPGAQGFVP